VRSHEDVLVIGITGNIGVGKSVVRKMAERLGSLGIDADALTHRALMKGSPVYDRVVAQFGAKIVDSGGQINRSKLAELVFPDQQSLQILENIIHPPLIQAIHQIIDINPLKVVVIEAIKLLESDLVDLCDVVWLVDAPRQEQMKRILKSRPMTVDQVRVRLENQSSSFEKRTRVQAIINNDRDFEKTWNAVKLEFEKATKSQRLSGKISHEIRSYQSPNCQFDYILPPHGEKLKKFLFSLSSDQAGVFSVLKYSPQPLNRKGLDNILRSNYFETLTNYVSATHAGFSLGMINLENFLLSPLFLHPPESDSLFDLTEWLFELETIATQNLSEAIIIPMRKSRSFEIGVLKENGFSELSKLAVLWEIWGQSNPNFYSSGYNVYSKKLRNTVLFE